MRRICALFLIVVLPVLVSAQKWDFAYIMGVTKPLGDFADNDIMSDNSGLAENGFFIQFNGNYSNNQKFGLATSLLLSSNSMDDRAGGMRFEKALERLFLNREVAPSERFNLSYNRSDWKWGALMVGPMLKLPSDNMTFVVKALTGVQINFIAEPELVYNDENQAKVFRSMLADGNKLSIPFMLGGELNYKVRSNISVRFGIEYYVSKINYEMRHETIRRDNQEVNNLERINLSVMPQNINLGVGFIYHIDI